MYFFNLCKPNLSGFWEYSQSHLPQPNQGWSTLSWRWGWGEGTTAWLASAPGGNSRSHQRPSPSRPLSPISLPWRLGSRTTSGCLPLTSAGDLVGHDWSANEDPHEARQQAILLQEDDLGSTPLQGPGAGGPEGKGQRCKKYFRFCEPGFRGWNFLRKCVIFDNFKIHLMHLECEALLGSN